MLLVIGLIFFVLLVVIHEYGHFLVAKRNGVEAEEFGIGFPPKIWGKTMGKGIFRTYYTINALPIGGFVKLKGENDSDTRKGSFGAASLWVKTKIALAGVAMNWLTAIIIFTILAIFGMPQLIENQFTIESDSKVNDSRVLVGFVEEVSPANDAGLQVGDELLTLGEDTVTVDSKLKEVADKYAGQNVTITYQRGEEIITQETQLRAERVKGQQATDTTERVEAQGILGVGELNYVTKQSTWSAPLVGIGTTVQVTAETLKGLGGLVVDLFSGDVQKASDSVSGPVGIFVLLQNSATIGARLVFLIIGIISVTLAVMNSLPIPALDGGRMFVTYLFKIIKKPLTPKLEERIHGTGMVVLLGLIALITFVDINRLFN